MIRGVTYATVFMAHVCDRTAPLHDWRALHGARALGLRGAR